MTPGEFRLRVRYGKVGRLRHLSHLEVIHAIERSIRRADLPFAVTQGFHPHLKAGYGPALPVGTAGDNEYYDVWLTRYIGADEVARKLAASTPADLAPLEVRYVPDRAPALTAALTIAMYRVELDGKETLAEQVRTALAELIEGKTLTVEHKGKKKVFDLTRSLPKGARVEGTPDGAVVEIAVRMGPEGSLRPDVLMKSALELAQAEALAVRTTRLDTLVEDDEGVWSRPV